MIAHRSPEMRELLARVYAALPPILGTTQPVYVASGAATGMMESAIRCGTRGRVLSLVAGAFGERFARIAESCDRSVTRLVAEPGDVVSADALRDALQHGAYDAVSAVHVETSTGAMADLAAYGRALAAHDDVLLLVDAVSSVGGVEMGMDAAGADFVLAASQKALALPPGLSFIACSPRAMARARGLSDRGVYLDVVRMDEYWRQGETAGTPAIPQLYALDAQLMAIGREGMAKRFARHAAMAELVQRWANERSGPGAQGPRVGILAREGVRAPTVSCLTIAGDAPRLAHLLRARGFEVGSGYGAMAASTIRIGHMGDHTVREVRALLLALDGALDELHAHAT
ncbi:MAG: aminotransferase class V-fold PLP-dependent enzyme [Gemmatimonadota bacterium]|nr:aminotransferase class V-fold PLP-dependent enzyme [Gemmatimonadota bacterium]